MENINNSYSAAIDLTKDSNFCVYFLTAMRMGCSPNSDNCIRCNDFAINSLQLKTYTHFEFQRKCISMAANWQMGKRHESVAINDVFVVFIFCLFLNVHSIIINICLCHIFIFLFSSCVRYVALFVGFHYNMTEWMNEWIVNNTVYVFILFYSLNSIGRRYNYENV